MSGAQALAAQLRSEGVDTVFALPGVQVMAAFDALHELRHDIRLIQTRHEQATTYMADGYAKATGKVGVALVVPGPGALNAAAGLGTAYASSSPVLLISGQIPSHTLGKRQGQLHEIEDQLDVFKPITKWNHRVTNVEDIPETVHEAMRQLKTGRPRPVEIEVPPDTLAAMGNVELIEPEVYPRASGSQQDIERAAQLLAKASKPAIIAGGGSIISGASQQLLQLAEFIQAPVMTTTQGKGIVSEDHYLSVGVNYYDIGPYHRVVPESDVVLGVGSRLLMGLDKLSEDQKLIHVDADLDELGRNHETEVAIHADATHALAQILGRLRAISAPKQSRRDEIAAYRDRFQRELRELAPEQLDIVETIRNEIDDDAIMVSGVTNVGYWGYMGHLTKQPRKFLTSSYFGTLGYAFPTALGAKAASPGTQVVATCGDGGFMYSPQELSTAMRYGINVVALVFNNNAYGASQWDQTHRYGQRYHGTDLNNPDFVKLAESFGAVGMRTDVDGLGESLRKALSADAPALLEVEVPVMMPPFQIVR